MRESYIRGDELYKIEQANEILMQNIIRYYNEGSYINTESVG
jgi:hypothetical protein